MKLRHVVLLLIVLVLAACASSPKGQVVDGYRRIGPAELAALLEEQPEVLVVNVHVPYEGEIPGTDAHIPFDEISQHLTALPGKAETLVLYCRSGSMSTTAANELVNLGYTKVIELQGGMRAWEAAGYELIWQ